MTTAAKPQIHAIHHPAIKCYDAEETRSFYENVLELPMNAAVAIDDDGLGGDFYFMHIFFRMGDGDFLAFFDKDTEIKPDLFKSFEVDDFRLTLRIESEAHLQRLEGRIRAAGIPYTGPVETALGTSVFLQDPNYLNIELNLPRADEESALADAKRNARAVLAAWTEKTAAQKTGLDEIRAANAAPPPPPA
jgi:catechol 2,3-dioxygenase-like lactoylglutathione lyase family enzyme